MSGFSVLKRAECRSVKIPDLDDLPRQQMSTKSRVRAAIRGNRRLTFREVAEEVRIRIGSCHQIFNEKLQGVASVQNSCRVC
jgi:hypothetical protein